MPKISGEDGFTIAELLVSTTILLIVTAGALTTFQNAVTVNDTASQISDANQNLRVGINQMIRDIMQAGRIIGPGGIPVPTGTGATAISRPAPPGQTLTFDLSTTTNLPDISTGYQLGPTIVGRATDLITLMTVDPFMSTIETPPATAGSPGVSEGTIDSMGAFVTLSPTSNWIIGDTINDTPAIQVGDLILFKNPKGMAIQTVTSKDSTRLYFAAGDWFNFNQRSTAVGFQGSVLQISPASVATSLFRVIMSTYYVDTVTTPAIPRLVRQANHFTPQALAGVVEGLGLTYDLVDGVNNPVGITSLPFYDSGLAVTFSANQIRKVNIRIGVRSETMSAQAADYVRNQISTSVDVRSLASVNRYVTE